MNVSDLQGFVHVKGAREHNLKNISLDIPRDAFVVFTGISGSGKSSLAFGTLCRSAAPVFGIGFSLRTKTFSPDGDSRRR